MPRALPLAAGAAALLLAACQSNTPQRLTAADSTALVSVRTDFAAAWNKGDVSALVRLYTGDATYLPADHPSVVGTDALRSYYDTVLGTPTRPKLDVPAGFFTGRQDMAMASGAYTVTPAAPAAPAKGAAPAAPAPLTGKYLLVLMRQADGSWKIRFDASSLDAPPAPPAPAAKPTSRRRGRR